MRRLADGFTGLYANSDLKLYAGNNPIFNTIPVEVNKVLLHSFADLLSTDFATITKHDVFNIPNAIQLFDPSDTDAPLVEQNDDDNEIQAIPQWAFDDVVNNPAQVTDEILPENDDVNDDNESNAKATIPAAIQADVQALDDDNDRLIDDNVPQMTNESMENEIDDEFLENDNEPNENRVRFEENTP